MDTKGMPIDQLSKYWFLSVKEISRILETNADTGLSAKEAAKRLLTFGRNTFESGKKTGKMKILANQFKSPLILVLIIAGSVMIGISHYRDAVFIFIAVVVNLLLGFWQENKAERALAELKTYLKQRAVIMRDGRDKEMDAEEIVPGDIIRLSQGNRVPADARISFVNDFQVDESILTGESLPVAKSADTSLESATIADQDSMVFAGTLVTQGVCTAIVCRTSAQTELGKIASLIAKSEDEKTPLQKAITRFSIYLSFVLGALTVVVFAIGLFSGRPFLEMFLTSVAIAVSAIPEGLPVSMTVILAVGVERMAKRKGVVRKLIAAEALGGTTVILTDKTGTLTMAKMAMSKIISFGPNTDKILSYALSNITVLIENPEDDPKAWRMNGKIMEIALAQSAAIRGIPVSEITDKSHVRQVMPFNAVKKFSASLIQESGKYKVIVFGAPDILIKHSALSEQRKSELLKEIDDLAMSGERVLGLATKDVLHADTFSFLNDSVFTGLSFDGLITFRDPIRRGIKNAIERVRRAGIKTIIVTGDHRGTAVAVAREIGLTVKDGSVLDASELTTLSDELLMSRLPNLAVISRVTPFDKLRIVKLFQKLGETVAMTGDGVNDAPGIKQADVGIAMGSGTEVSQNVADLVLLDDNFETIVAAVEEGRQILGNIRKVLVYLLSNVADELILIGGSLLVGAPLPLNALQILWVNFFSDSFPAIAFAFEKDADGLMRKPKAKKVTLFDPLTKFLILIIGILTSALLLVVYLVLLGLGYDTGLVRTFIFASFGTYTLFVALSLRSMHKSIFSYSLFSNRYLSVGILAGLILMTIAIYLPSMQNIFGTVSLPLNWVAGVLLMGIVNIFLIEAAKKIFNPKDTDG